MIAPQPLYDPVRPNLKHKTNVLDVYRLPSARCEMEFRPPSQRWSLRGESVVPILAAASLVGVVLSFVIRHPYGTNIVLIASALAAVLSVPLGIPGVVTWACFSATKVREIFRRRTTGQLFREFVLLPALLWLIALASCTTRWETTAFLFSLVFAWPATLRAADLLATHALYYLSSQPRLDRVTQIKWRADWNYRFQGFSRPKPRRGDLTPAQRDDFDDLLVMRGRYRWGRWWLLAAWATPVIWGWLLFIEHWAVQRLFVTGGIVAALGVWTRTQARLCPGSWSVFRLAFASWLNFEFPGESPPWVFNTPVGDQRSRRFVARISVALIAMSFVPLTFAGSFRLAGWLDWSALMLSLLTSFALPIVVFVLALYGITAPVLSAWFQLLEAKGALEHLPGETAFDGYVRRIQESQEPLERKCLFLGFNAAHEYPVLLDSDLLFEHLHMLGATGIGKTALGLATLVVQLIRRGDGSVVVVDCKGDPAFFNTVRLEAEKSGRKFKWFTNQPDHSTYVFNPFQQAYLDRLTLLQVVGLFIQSLNLHHGDDYGRAWFSSVSRALLKLALEVTRPRVQRHSGRTTAAKFPRITSFRDLHETIRLLAKDGDEFEAARHLCLIIEMLSEFEQLNLSSRHDPQHPAVQNAIHMPEVIRDKQVIYFHLVGAIDQTSVSEVARMAMYSLLTAAMAHREQTGETPRCYFIADEAQLLVAQNIQNVLAQARSYGVACILAHQSMSQLHPPGAVDLSELVLNCTTVKQYFSARDPKTMRYISDVSGQVGYFQKSWNQTPLSVARDRVSIAFAARRSSEEAPLIGITELTAPRLSAQDIQDVNFDPNQSVLIIERGSGLSQFQGAFPMRTDWPIAQSEFLRRRDQLPWPAASDETMTIDSGWPAATPVTVIPTTHPGNVDAVLKGIRDAAENN